MKIMFTEQYEVKDGTKTIYRPGDIVEMNTSSANHFIDRHVANEVSNDMGTRRVRAKSHAGTSQLLQGKGKRTRHK